MVIKIFTPFLVGQQVALVVFGLVHLLGLVSLSEFYLLLFKMFSSELHLKEVSIQKLLIQIGYYGVWTKLSRPARKYSMLNKVNCIVTEIEDKIDILPGWDPLLKGESHALDREAYSVNVETYTMLTMNTTI